MRFSAFCLLSLLLGASSAVQAENAANGKAQADAVAAFVDEQTIGVAHVDLSRIDLDRLLEQAAELAPGSEKLLAPTVEKLQPQAKRLIEAGAKDVYLAVSLAELQQPIVVLKLADGSDAKAVEDAMGKMPLERVGNMLVASGKQSLERIAKQSPAARPEIARAFEAAGDTAAQILLLPTADNRRVVEELLPALPAEVGGGSSQVLTRGVMWAAVGIALSPRPAIQLTIQSQDADAASAFRDKWLAMLQLIGRDARIAKALPRFAQLANQLEPKVKGDRIQLALDIESPSWKPLTKLLQTGLGEVQQSEMRKRTVVHFKQIGIAFHNYHDVYNTFPAAASYSPEGKPLLSWRVHILPFLDQAPLYKEFHLDEPWDSEHNRKLIERMPKTYRSRNWSPDEPTKTCLVGVTSDPDRAVAAPGGGAGAPVKDRLGTMFQGRDGIKLQQVTDGTSNTILIVETDPEHAVVWTKPDDLPYDAGQPVKGFGFDENGVVPMLFCDGSVRMLKESLEAETWQRLMLRNDGNPVPAN